MMKILIAEDDPSTSLLLKKSLVMWHFDVIATNNGCQALEILQQECHPPLAILDWGMPGLEGIEVCKRIRKIKRLDSLYIIILTARSDKGDIVRGLHAGANDYIVKPFHREELHARVTAGARVIRLQYELAKRIQELEHALANVKVLQGLIPICAYCKKVRDDKNFWQQVDNYIGKHSDVKFSHSLCPECYEIHVKPEIEKLKRSQNTPSR